MSFSLLVAIKDVIVFCICPVLIILDFSYSSLSFDKVFATCDAWWRAIKSVPFEKLISDLPVRTTDVFNAIYGKKHLSPLCVFRSVISSLVAMLLVFFFLNAVDIIGHSNNAYGQMEKALVVMGQRTDTHPLILFAFLIFINLAVDYLSLLETRHILSKTKKPSVSKTLFLAVIDYGFTTIIWVAAFYGIFFVLDKISVSGPIPFVELSGFWDVIFFIFTFANEYLTHGSIASGKGVAVGHVIGLFSISTYFTSIVFYIFSGISIFLRMVHGISDRVADILFHYGEKRFPRPLMLLAIVLGAVSEASIAIINFVSEIGK